MLYLVSIKGTKQSKNTTNNIVKKSYQKDKNNLAKDFLLLPQRTEKQKNTNNLYKPLF